MDHRLTETLEVMVDYQKMNVDQSRQNRKESLDSIQILVNH